MNLEVTLFNFNFITGQSARHRLMVVDLPDTENLRPRKKLNNLFRKIKFKREPEPLMFLNLGNLY